MIMESHNTQVLDPENPTDKMVLARIQDSKEEVSFHCLRLKSLKSGPRAVGVAGSPEARAGHPVLVLKSLSPSAVVPQAAEEPSLRGRASGTPTSLPLVTPPSPLPSSPGPG